MFKRKNLKKRTSKKLFTKTASKIHRKNTRSKPMRGGIRL